MRTGNGKYAGKKHAPRATGQARAIHPHQDERIQKLGQALAQCGIPAALSEIVAEGYVSRLRRWVYEQMDDCVGTRDDLELMLGWNGPPRHLAIALEKFHYIKEVNGVLVAVDAVNEAPQYVAQRWRRWHKKGWVKAMERANNPNVVNNKIDEQLEAQHEDREREAAVEVDHTLFGPVEQITEGKTHGAGIPGHRELVAYWHERYPSTPEGLAYPWRKRDFKIVGDILAAVGDIHRCKDIFDRYLKCRQPFFAGHDLSKLLGQLPQFTGAGVRGAEFASQATTESAIL
jgi:hypothetical protein